MHPTMLETTEDAEARIVRFAERPISLETFLTLNNNNDMELIAGVMVKKMAAQLEHEKLLAWLFWLMFGYVRQRKQGFVISSRTAVRIDDHHARLPDLLFVRQDRVDIVQQKAIYGAPDLVIELVSPNDRPSDIIALETDYRSIGVPEIVFIDQQKKRVRLLCKRSKDAVENSEPNYEETILRTGKIAFETVPGFELQVEWLFAEQHPDELALLNALLNA